MYISIFDYTYIIIKKLHCVILLKHLGEHGQLVTSYDPVLSCRHPVQRPSMLTVLYESYMLALSLRSWRLRVLAPRHLRSSSNIRFRSQKCAVFWGSRPGELRTDAHRREINR